MEKAPLKKTKSVGVKRPIEAESPLQFGVTPRTIPKSVIRIKPTRKWLDGMERGIDGVVDFMRGVTTLGIRMVPIQKGLNEMLRGVT